MLLSTDTASRYILMANTNPAILHAITCKKYQNINFRDKIQQKEPISILMSTSIQSRENIFQELQLTRYCFNLQCDLSKSFQYNHQSYSQYLLLTTSNIEEPKEMLIQAACILVRSWLHNMQGLDK